MPSNTITTNATALTVEPKSLDKILGFQGQLTIPLTHVMGATLDPGILADSRGWRAPGFSTGGKIAGTFRSNGENVYWNITRDEEPIVIQLRGERYDRLVLGTADPQQTVETINNAIQFTKNDTDSK